nr:MAG TPA: hypothetical protein [Caudoviricetes sp.]
MVSSFLSLILVYFTIEFTLLLFTVPYLFT